MLKAILTVEVLALVAAGMFLAHRWWGGGSDARTLSHPTLAADARAAAPITPHPPSPLRAADTSPPAAGEPQGLPQPAPVVPPAAASRPASGAESLPPSRPAPAAEVRLSHLVSPRIVVDKSALRLTVFDGGRAVKTYRVAVGAAPGDKQREGDRRTPEGIFRVCVRNPHSQYVLSLGLDYPCIADAERGINAGLISEAQYRAIVEAARTGCRPPWNTPLGGEIMIHGRRDGRDETLGCVAMDDAAIRELYPLIPLGTEVEIRP